MRGPMGSLELGLQVFNESIHRLALRVLEDWQRTSRLIYCTDLILLLIYVMFVSVHMVLIPCSSVDSLRRSVLRQELLEAIRNENVEEADAAD